MNYNSWLSTLQDTVARWGDCKSFTLLRNNVNPPQSRSHILNTLQRCCRANIPEDLLQFYAEAANGCDIHFQIELMTSGEPRPIIVCQRDLRSGLHGGFGLDSAEEVCNSQRKLREILSEFKEQAESGAEDIQKVRQMEEFLDAAIPIWTNWGHQHLFLVGNNSLLREGLYWLDHGDLLNLESNSCYLVCSLSEWLQFLEENLYLGASMTEMRYFIKCIPSEDLESMSVKQILEFDYGPIVGNLELCEKIKDMAKLP